MAYERDEGFPKWGCTDVCSRWLLFRCQTSCFRWPLGSPGRIHSSASVQKCWPLGSCSAIFYCSKIFGGSLGTSTCEQTSLYFWWETISSHISIIWVTKVTQSQGFSCTAWLKEVMCWTITACTAAPWDNQELYVIAVKRTSGVVILT